MKGRRNRKQAVANAGLYYVGYELSKRGWNVLPTTRNARGPDLIIYSQDADIKLAVQVKALSTRTTVILGDSVNRTEDFLIVCILTDTGTTPEVFILPGDQVWPVSKLGTLAHRSETKGGGETYWITYKDYKRFRDRWGPLEGTSRDLDYKSQ